jgi:hypothetical protein
MQSFPLHCSEKMGGQTIMNGRTCIYREIIVWVPLVHLLHVYALEMHVHDGASFFQLQEHELNIVPEADHRHYSLLPVRRFPTLLYEMARCLEQAHLPALLPALQRSFIL